MREDAGPRQPGSAATRVLVPGDAVHKRHQALPCWTPPDQERRCRERGDAGQHLHPPVSRDAEPDRERDSHQDSEHREADVVQRALDLPPDARAHGRFERRRAVNRSARRAAPRTRLALLHRYVAPLVKDETALPALDPALDRLPACFRHSRSLRERLDRE
jgi:hypothetical protein